MQLPCVPRKRVRHRQSFGVPPVLLLHALCCVRGQNEGAYYAAWCGGQLQFLDDSKCAKVFPGNTLRNLTCEASIVADKAHLAPGFEPDGAHRSGHCRSIEWLRTA